MKYLHRVSAYANFTTVIFTSARKFFTNAEFTQASTLLKQIFPRTKKIFWQLMSKTSRYFLTIIFSINRNLKVTYVLYYKQEK